MSDSQLTIAHSMVRYISRQGSLVSQEETYGYRNFVEFTIGEITMAPSQTKVEQPYVVKPVYKALQVLIALGDEHRPLTLTEICHRVRLPKTTVFRYLQTLAQCGFVAHNRQEDMYHLGARLFELGQLAGQLLRIRDVALPVMVGLRDHFNETVNLGIL